MIEYDGAMRNEEMMRLRITLVGPSNKRMNRLSTEERMNLSI